MSAGNWLNNDGLNLNFGTTKALPEIAGDYVMYGDQREIEVYLNLAPDTVTAGGNVLPGLLQYSTLLFGSSTTTAAAAGIISETVLFPLQTTTNTLTGTVSGIITPQLFLESIEVVTLIPMTASSATGINLGLVTAQTGQASGPPTWWVQVAPNAGVQLLTGSAFVNSQFTTVGQKVILYPTTQIPAAAAGQGSWLVDGNVPLTTTTVGAASTTPLAQSAFLSAGAVGGTYTGGLLKIRIRYSYYGLINN
jgi:hypothetical protein